MHDRGKFDSVIRRCQDNVRQTPARHSRSERNTQNSIRQCRSSSRSAFLRMQLVPTHVRHAQIWRQFHNASLKEIQSAMQTELFAFGEQQMHAEADPNVGVPDFTLSMNGSTDRARSDSPCRRGTRQHPEG